MVADLSTDTIIVAILAAVTLGACSSSDGGGDDSTVYFTPLERQKSVTESVEPPSPPISLEDRPSYQQIISGFRTRAVELLKRDGIEQRLEQIERVFLGTGKYLELVAIYQDAYEKLGAESPVAERLAWSYIRLGQRKQARKLLDELKQARSDDATVAFLEGFYWMNTGQKSPKALARAVLQWRRVLELDPDFSGFRRVSARSLKAQIGRIERRLPKAPEAIVGGETAGDGGPKAEGRGQKAEGGGPKAEDGGQKAQGGGPMRAGASDQTGAAGREETSETSSARQEQAESAETKPSETAQKGGDDKSQGQTPTGVVMMRADKALESGELNKADRLYRKVLDREPEHVGARMGLLRVGWKSDPDNPETVKYARQLASSGDLSARQAYELSLFAKVRLKKPKLAESLRQRVRELDPEFAKKVGIE
ncbi:MAG: hypothetical protein ABEN55_17290 [Bradymonadaceae bacterium]